METLQRSESDEGTPGTEKPNSDIRRRAASLSTRERVRIGLGFVVVLGLIYWAFVEPKIRTTVTTVLIAVGASAGLWIGANFLFDLVRPKWLTFSTIVFGIVGAVVGVLLHGNLITIGSGTGFLTWVVGPLAGVEDVSREPIHALVVGHVRRGQAAHGGDEEARGDAFPAAGLQHPALALIVPGAVLHAGL